MTESKTKLSSHVLEMKFMKKSKEKCEMEAEEEKRKILFESEIPDALIKGGLRSFVAPVATKGDRDGAMIDQKVEFFLIQPRSPMWRWLSVGQNLKNELETKLKNIKLDELDSCGEKFSFLKLAIVQAGNPVIGKVKKKKCDDWFDLECRVATKLKNKAHKNRIQRKHTRIAIDEYKYARKNETKIHLIKKRNFHENLLRDVEHLRGKKKIYKHNGKELKDYCKLLKGQTAISLKMKIEFLKAVDQKQKMKMEICKDFDVFL
ncbi:UNVERIFIED_CONTAM: hypothetical protein NCL1_18894 [Trichonephila clavipes]